MIILAGANDKLQIVLDAAITVDVLASWVDHDAGDMAPGRTPSALATAATHDIVSGIGAGIQRAIQSLFATNKHASTSVNVTVQMTDGTTTFRFPKVQLAPGETLQYIDGVGFNVLTASGGIKQSTAGAGAWTDLGGVELTGNAVTTGALTIPAYDMLRVSVIVTGYSGADIASLRFNADAGNNYWSRYISSVAGGVVFVNNQNVSQPLARLFALTSTQRRSALVHIINHAAHPKVGAVMAQTSTGAAGTAGILEQGGFEWVNTAAQITSIEMRTAGGAITMPAGTGFAVEGRNLP